VNNTLTIFDLDHTLLNPDQKQDECSLYMKPVHELIPGMWEIFECADPKIILTSRHPDLEMYIQKWVGDCPIYCRNYCLSQEEMEITESNHEMKELFLAQMIEWKTGVVNEFAQHYEIWLQNTGNETFLYKDLPDRLQSKKHFYRAVAEDLLKKAGRARVPNSGDKRTVWRVVG